MAVAPGSEDDFVPNGSSLYSKNSSTMSDQNLEADELLNALSQEQSSRGVASQSIKAADQQSNKALLQFLPPNLSKVVTQPMPETCSTAQHHQARVFRRKCITSTPFTIWDAHDFFRLDLLSWLVWASVLAYISA